MPELEIPLTYEQMMVLQEYAAIRQMERNDVFGSTVMPAIIAAAIEQQREPGEGAE